MSQKVSIHEILANKEKRVELQKEFLKLYSSPLVCMSVNMPGAYKLTPVSTKIFDEVYKALLSELSDFQIFKSFTCKESTGKEAIFSIGTDKYTLKQLTCKLENTHPLGRFVDIDVIGLDGLAISRKELGFDARRCYLCSKDAKVCGRSRAHTIDELVEFMDFSLKRFEDGV